MGQAADSLGRWIRLAGVIVGAGVAVGCASDPRSEATARSSDALSATAARVLGFDSVGDWTAVGATLAPGSRHIQGTGALAVSNLVYATVTSRTLSTLGSSEIGSIIGFDIQIPELQPNPSYFGAVQLYVDLPSRGIQNVLVGQKELTYLPRQSFRRVELPLSATLQTALRGTYSDLRVTIALNTPGGTGPYLLDRISFTHQESEPIDNSRNANILGFETLSSWLSSAGTTALSSDHTEKTLALSVTPSGWTVITSDRLATPSQSSDLVGFDFKMPEVGANPGWLGETQLYVDLPSQGIFSAYIGRHDLSALRAGSFQRVSYTLPASIAVKLAQPFDDLRFKIVLNTPLGSGPYLFDRFRFGPVDDPSETVELTLPFPENILPSQLFLLASNRLSIGPRVRIPEVRGTRLVVASTGPGGVQIGAGAELDSILSYGGVNIGEGARVTGYVSGTANPVVGANAEVYGTTSGSRAPLEMVRWSMHFPSTTKDFFATTDGQESLEPGRYRSVEVRNGTLRLRPGTFFIDWLSVLPNTTLLIDSTQGSLVVATRSELDLRGALVDRADQTLQGPFSTPSPVFIYAGRNDLTLPASLPGSLIAPNAKVAVRIPANGSGSSVSVWSDSIDITSVGTGFADFVPGRPGSLTLLPTDVRVVAQGNDNTRGVLEASPVFVTEDNPWFFGGFAWQGNESGTVTPAYVGAQWDGIDQARIALRRLRPGVGPILGWSAPLFPAFPPMPCCGRSNGVISAENTQFASFATRGHNLWHGTTFRATRALRHANGEVLGGVGSGSQGLYVALSPDVHVVPVVIIGWDGESTLGELTAAIDIVRANPFPGDLPVGMERAPAPPFFNPEARETPPDEIWAQCGIQFQVVKALYLGQADVRPVGNTQGQCNAGTGACCTDEHTQDYVSNEELSARLHAALGPEFDEIFGEQGLQPVLIQYGRPRAAQSGCSEYTGKATAEVRTYADVHTGGLVQINQFIPRRVTAHELGHILIGQSHLGDGLLMSRGAPSTNLPAEHCALARGMSGGLSQRYDDYNIRRGFADAPPPRPPSPLPRYPAAPDGTRVGGVYDSICCALGSGAKQRTSSVGCFFQRGTPTTDCNVCCSEDDQQFERVDTEACEPSDVRSADDCTQVCCDLESGRVNIPRGECAFLGGEECLVEPP